MNLNDALKVCEGLNKSPIRGKLKISEKKIFFENEKKVFENIDSIIRGNKENLKNPLKVVILGEVKAGKSTLINALVGKRVSYTNVLEATAAIIEIKYSKEEKVIVKMKDNDIVYKNLKELDELIECKKEDKEFFSKVQKISIATNTQRLREITLVDTPGLNTITIENEERTENYIVNSDVILWVLNSHHLGQADVTDKIEKIMDYGKPIIGVLNRIDEVNGSIEELIEYVEDEMGYMFVEILGISAQKAWEGYSEGNNIKIKESNIENLYYYVLENIEKNADEIQINSIIESMYIQFRRDLNIHKLVKIRVEGLIKKFQADIDELENFNNRLKKIIYNEIDIWIKTQFFEMEKLELQNATNNEWKKLIEKYSDNKYIENIVNDKYKNLNKYILDEWTNNIQQFLNKQELDDIAIENSIKLMLEVEESNISTEELVDSVKKSGITASAIGLGLAGYTAWLGPAAATVTIGGALSAIMPPVLIVGLIGGIATKLVNSEKQKVDKYKKNNEFVSTIKNTITKDVSKNMGKHLFDISDYYLNEAKSIVVSILEQSHISFEEIKKIDKDIDRYIDYIRKLGINEDVEDYGFKFINNINNAKNTKSYLTIKDDLKYRYPSMDESALESLATGEYLYNENKEELKDFAPVAIAMAKSIEIQINKTLNLDEEKTIGEILYIIKTHKEFIKNYKDFNKSYNILEKIRLIRNSAAHTGNLNKTSIDNLRNLIYHENCLENILLLDSHHKKVNIC